ncbi:DUF4350 domain-containing protein [Mycobacterium sp. 236(2023)]|uniref:DUF4350 domain-containing protein n=1 Tax=Mycobacterium sp. 236(2023) TaxID=3038163 RepID=UPI002415738A|nr:DUF4350 domain-containing protein [Mycobacterium sp. 236(2023)]MDG4665199.1 DUF4350 domain-containing protein [Mycobacterium sp. 236(2023)]
MSTSTAVGSTITQRWRGLRWVLLGLVAIVAVATATTLLTAPRLGGRLDPASTSPEGVHALMALLRDHGVTVVEAGTIDDVEREAQDGTLVVAAQTFHLFDDELLQRLSEVPGDRLLIAPIGRTREALAPELTHVDATEYTGLTPGCDLREANQAGAVQFGVAETFEAQGSVPVTTCYEGALARYTDAGRTITVVGSDEFVLNSRLSDEGNAALAMNLAGTQPRMIWYAPQFDQGGGSSGSASFTDLIPSQVYWMILQLALGVALLAWWRGRRVGPLVAEQLPVVVRASETVEGRGRLYRSRRARDIAAESLRASTRQRMLPRLGLDQAATEPEVVAAVADRCALDSHSVGSTLYGPHPATDADLVNLARALDDIERQVAQS